MGANRQGYAVFKEPRAAMDNVCYDVEIGARGWKEAAFVSRFVGIYENGFEGDPEEDLRDEAEGTDTEPDEENQQ